jgi:Polysaccharide lyase family 4, domain II
MVRRNLLGLSTALLALLIMPGPITAATTTTYQTKAVTHGGTLSGRVTLEGTPPPARVFPIVLYPFGPYCKRNTGLYDGQGHIRVTEFRTGPNGGLRDVIVAIEGVKAGKPFEPITATVRAKDCEFLPFVNVVQNQGALKVENEDPILHNSQVYQSEKGNIILNVPMAPNSTSDHTINFEKHHRIYQMICGMHEFMQTWGYAVDNPYYAKVDDQGRFTIDQIPPGKYKVIAWHAHIEPIEREITVKADGRVTVNFEFEADEVKLPHYETQEKFRVGS